MKEYKLQVVPFEKDVNSKVTKCSMEDSKKL